MGGGGWADFDRVWDVRTAAPLAEVAGVAVTGDVLIVPVGDGDALRPDVIGYFGRVSSACW